VFVIRPRSSITTDQYRDWLTRCVREPEKRRLALAALDAFDRVSGLGKVHPDDLAAITEAACSRYKPVSVIGTDLLMRVAGKYPEGQEAIRRILESGPATARFQVTDAITGDLPRAFAKAIIRMALRDRGSRVRDQGALACGRLGLKECYRLWRPVWMLSEIKMSKTPCDSSSPCFAMATCCPTGMASRNSGFRLQADTAARRSRNKRSMKASCQP